MRGRSLLGLPAHPRVDWRGAASVQVPNNSTRASIGFVTEGGAILPRLATPLAAGAASLGG
jgi:hypothetical protein